MNITLHDVAHLYRFFTERGDGSNAANLKNAFVHLREAAEMEDGPGKTAMVKTSVAFLAVTANDLRTNYAEETSSELIQQMKALSKDTFPGFIKQIAAIAKRHFPKPECVEWVLSGETFRGFTGLYGLVMKRADLQYRHGFLMTLPRPLSTIVKSFGKEVPRGAGIEALKQLVLMLQKHKNAIAELCNDDADDFVRAAAKLNKDEIEPFYDRLLTCCMAESEGGDVCEVVSTEAEKSVPKIEMGENLAKLAKTRAEGFGHQKDHGGGAFLAGTYGVAGRGTFSGQYFGHGILDDGGSSPVNPFSAASLDQVDDPVRKQLKEFGMNIVRAFYDRGELATRQAVVIDRTVKEIEVENPVHQAAMTVKTLIHYKLAEFERENHRLFGLDIDERERLTPRFAKEIILHGIRNRIFTVQQGAALVGRYHLTHDLDILAASVQALQIGGEEKKDD